MRLLLYDACAVTHDLGLKTLQPYLVDSYSSQEYFLIESWLPLDYLIQALRRLTHESIDFHSVSDLPTIASNPWHAPAFHELDKDSPRHPAKHGGALDWKDDGVACAQIVHIRPTGRI